MRLIPTREVTMSYNLYYNHFDSWVVPHHFLLISKEKRNVIVLFSEKINIKLVHYSTRFMGENVINLKTSIWLKYLSKKETKCVMMARNQTEYNSFGTNWYKFLSPNCRPFWKLSVIVTVLGGFINWSFLVHQLLREVQINYL